MINNMYKKFNIDDDIINLVEETEKELHDEFNKINKVYEQNQLKVLNAFIKNEVSERHFYESTGYGYNDDGRDVIEKVFADIFNTEDALVRQQIVSGTHAISLVLFALNKSNDNILSITGMPYDTLKAVIGLNNEVASLKYYDIGFDYAELKNDYFDFDEIKKKINDKTNLIMIQKSKGYSSRHSFSNEEISEAIKFLKGIKTDVIVMVDNCYGELVEETEPSDYGADIVVGSLIKNLGGGIAKSGGYIVGKKDLIDLCSYRLTAPCLGKEVGISYNQNRNVLEGLFLAPQVVANALKGSRLFAKTYYKIGYKTYPSYDEKFNDIVLAIELKKPDVLENFCNAIQHSSTVDSFLKPVFSDMPGYDSKVIMASGSFVSGSSIELSCDGPLREPYIAYFQGGLSYYQIKLALMKTITYIKNGNR